VTALPVSAARTVAGVSAQTLPGVSVVLPVRNGAAVLAACLDSLLAQDLPPSRREIIAVDNGSTDATARVLARYAAQVRMLAEPRRGASHARNAAIRVARHGVIAFIDADCVAEPGWLAGLLRPLAADPGLAGVGGRILALPGAGAVARFGEEIHDHAKAIAVWHPPYIISMGSAVRRSVLDAVGLFDQAFLRGQDVELSFRMHLAGHRLAYAPDAVIHHRNEDTLGGLFREGHTHGKWQVLLHRQYADRLFPGQPRIRMQEYRRLGQHVAQVARSLLRGRRPEPATLCRLVFFSGKKLGNLTGSIRFRHVRL
jgi:glycosyltransferase involved in cell wall biosynthesis